jgi:hypothetical protein
MIGSRLIGCVSALVACIGLGGAAVAGPLAIDLSDVSTSQAIPVVVFGENARETIAEFASAHHASAAVLRRDYAASGIVRCGLAHGAGQLTLSNDVITTAAHVFFDESGKPRAESCRFEVMRGDATVSVSVNMKSIVAGSRNPYAIAAVHDWAVARLDMPIADATPYQIAPPQRPGAPVKFVARGHIDWGHARRLSLQDCRLHDQLNRSPEGTREFSFDCETGDGASGGALMTRDGVGELCAVLVGYRSISPDSPLPFSPLHYNFVVTVEGAFKSAVEAMARPSIKSVVAANGDRVPN